MFGRARTRLLAAPLLFAAMLACRARDDGPEAKGGEGWLVNSIASQGGWSFQRTAGGRHLWMWMPDEPGLSILSADGTSRKAGMPEVPVRTVKPLGDGEYALAGTDGAGTYLVNRDGAIQPRKVAIDSLSTVFDTPAGSWILHSSEDRQFLSFIKAGTTTIQGTWQTAGGRFMTAGPYLVSPRERDKAGFDFDVYTPDRGPVSFSISLPYADPNYVFLPYQQMTVKESVIWFDPDLENAGVLRIDLEQALLAARNGIAYEPQRFFAGDGRERLSVSNSKIAWALRTIEQGDEEAGTYKWTASLHLIDAAAGTVRSIDTASESIESAMALEDGSCLVEVKRPEGVTVLHVAPSGEVAEVATGYLFSRRFDDTIEVRPHLTPGHLILDGGRGVHNFDIARRQLTFLGTGLEVLHVDKRPAGARVWLASLGDVKDTPRGILLYDAASGRYLNQNTPLFAKEPNLPALHPFGDGKTAAAVSDQMGAVLIRSDFRGDLELSLGKGTLRGNRAAREIAFDPAGINVRAALHRWPKSVFLDESAKLTLTIASRNWDPLVMRSNTLQVGGTHEFHVVRRPHEAIGYGDDVTIEAVLTDDYGTRIAWNWNGIHFVPPEALIDRPWFRSVVLFAVVCILTLIAAGLRGGLQRWMPIVVYSLGAGAGVITTFGKMIDGPVFLGLMFVTLCAATIAGIVSPTVFRELERLEPFRSFAPLALRIPAMRRRVYAGYARRVAANVELARGRTRRESYAPLPVDVLDARATGIDADAPPAEQLLAVLSADRPGDRAHVLITSTGGRGKSALLRQIVVTALERFGRDPASVLPIVCEGSKPTLFDRAVEALATEGFSEELLRTLMRSGEFFLVVDGVTESGVTAAMVREHNARFGTACPLLLTARPNRELREAVESTSAWILVEPRWLGEKTLPRFLAAYGRGDADLAEPLRTVCRYETDKFLPILVRLAILAPPGQEARSIADIYRNAFNQLVSGTGADLYEKAIELCMESYWRDGERQMAYASAPPERKEAMERLLAAGVLLPADLSLAGSVEPRTVKFFHDTMQSYLTAVGLSRRLDAWEEALEEAAGADRFARDRSELGGDGSELFQLCVHVFDPRARLQETLRKGLVRCAEQWGSSLSRDWVVKAAGLAELESMAGRRMGGGDVLEMAIGIAVKANDLRTLASLYAKTVRQLWPAIEADREAEAGQARAG